MKQSFKAWAQADAKTAQAVEAVALTRDEYTAEVARRKHAQSVSRSATRQVVALEIMESLREFQMRSLHEQVTLLSISPLNGLKQTLVVITPDMDMEQTLTKLSAYYKAVFAEEDLLKLPENKIDGFNLSRVPKSKYRMDLYIAGQDICLAETDFAELSRKTLQNLPSLVRVAQRVTASLKTPEGIEISNPRHNPTIKEKVKQLLQASLS